MKTRSKKQDISEIIKVSVPKDAHWQVFGMLITDLEESQPVFTTPETEAYFRSNVTELRAAIRGRDVHRLYDCIPNLEPPSILERISYSKQDAQAFYTLYQIGSFLKKYPFKGEDTKAPALDKFAQSEHLCGLYNDENHKALLSLNELHPEYLGVVEEIRADILQLIGEYPNIDSILSHAIHGPGVSLGDLYKNGKTTEYYKWSSLPYSVTESALPLAKAAIQADPRWVGALDNWYRKEYAIPVGAPLDIEAFWGSVFDVVAGSRTTTVPKTAVIDRTIAIEPVLNVFLQLGLDRVLRKNLVRGWGYDLNDQVRNQELAHEGSVTDELVTVDLSMASDLISLKICETYLPPAWYDLLLDLRSPETQVNGNQVTLEKLSSMGNGYTFAIESLIFASLVRCSIRRTKSKKISAVFGDDLIVPKTAFPYLQDLLNLSGFKLNANKSFSSGPFRESCGKDFFLGYDVRPIFLKRPLVRLLDVFYIHNAVFALEQRLCWTWEVAFERTLKLLKKWIPKIIRDTFYGPETESLDTHMFSRKRLKRNKFNQRCFQQLIAVPKLFNTGPYRRTIFGKKVRSETNFWFRKLMVSLKPREAPNRWDLERRFNTGNAFDVTKRGQVRYQRTEVCLP